MTEGQTFCHCLGVTVVIAVSESRHRWSSIPSFGTEVRALLRARIVDAAEEEASATLAVLDGEKKWMIYPHFDW